MIKLSSSELSHVQRMATRCRDAKQCAVVFKDSFRGLANVLAAHAAHQSSSGSGAALVGPPPSLQSNHAYLDNHRAASAPPLMARNGITTTSAGPARGSASPLAVASARVEALRLLQGLVIAYENMTVDQRNKAVLKEKAFAGSLGTLLEVGATSYFIFKGNWVVSVHFATLV